MYYIYTLNDPRDNQIRYIGMSSDPIGRFSQHLTPTFNVKPGKDVWVKELLHLSLIPGIEVIDQTEIKGEIRTLEAYWILHHLNQGADLVNGEVVWARESRHDYEAYLARLKVRASKKLQSQIAEQKQALVERQVQA